MSSRHPLNDSDSDYTLTLLHRLSSMTQPQWQPARQPMDDHRQLPGQPRSDVPFPSHNLTTTGHGGLLNPLEGGTRQGPQDCPPTYSSAMNDWPSAVPSAAASHTIHVHNGVGLNFRNQSLLCFLLFNPYLSRCLKVGNQQGLRVHHLRSHAHHLRSPPR